jgi:hypothetical protein
MTTVRAGLTLVEMLVALALSVFMMAILSEAFVQGLKSFADLKALGDLDDRLRTVANVLRRDLRAPHFEGSRRLSECTASGKAMPRLEDLTGSFGGGGIYNLSDTNDLRNQLRPYLMASPRLGYFHIEGAPNVGLFWEGTDSQSRPSYRDVTDVLGFTVHLLGNEEEKFLYGRVEPGSPLDGFGRVGARYDQTANQMFSSQWAEVFYFLDTDGSQNAPGVTPLGGPSSGGPIQTFNLYRRRLLLVPDQFSEPTVINGSTYYSAPPDNNYRNAGTMAQATAAYYRDNDVSAYGVNTGNGPDFYYNTPADIQHTARRFPFRTARTTSNGSRDGGDLLLTNVISFDVKVWDPFAYRIPLTPASGRGAYVDIGSNFNKALNPNFSNDLPTAATVSNDVLTPVYGYTLNQNLPGNTPPLSYFDTGTDRNDSAFWAQPPNDILVPYRSPRTHDYPFNSIQITIRVYEPKSKQTRQITIIQDM